MNEPFERTHFSDKPGIIGARWWQESLAISGDPVLRRQALQSLAIVGASILGVGVIGSVTCASALSGDDDTRLEKRDALATQRDYGWNFGAEAEPLTFDGQSYAPFDRSAPLTLVNDLTPTTAALRPYYVPTLFQSLIGVPKILLPGSATAPKLLKDVLVPIQTAAMKEAYRQGKALASLVAGTPGDRAVIVDMDGPLSVAFAAGASSVLEPVFVFDNWPHPLGVVPAHLTLAAVAHYQPLFARMQSARKGTVYPLFVLDRNRFNPYTSEHTQFDNRYVARLPPFSALRALGDSKVLYVNPSASYNQEADDLNGDLVEYARNGIDVKMVAASDFRPDASSPASPPPGTPPPVTPDDWPPYYYSGSADSHEGFWSDYPWNPPRRPVKSPPSGTSGLASYRPVPRTTLYTNTGTGTSKTRPASVGAVPVVVAAATGIVVGAAVSRSGSYGRYSSSWGGG
jgi:hypothetical protein